jgi:hypothetical protein
MFFTDVGVQDETQVLNRHTNALVKHITTEALWNSVLKKVYSVLQILEVACEPWEDVKDLGDKKQTGRGREILKNWLKAISIEMSKDRAGKKSLKRCEDCADRMFVLFSQGNEESSLVYLAGNSGAGVLCLTALFVSEPIRTLEIDCRGLIIVSHNDGKDFTTIEMGEIKQRLKGSEGEAKEQLRLRLRVVAFVHMLIMQTQYKKRPTITLIGRIFHGESGADNVRTKESVDTTEGSFDLQFLSHFVQ